MSNNTKIAPYCEIKPMVYAYTTPDVVKLRAYTKIGYTDKQTVGDRISQQSGQIPIKKDFCWAEEAKYKDGEVFNDHAFHYYMQNFYSVERYVEDGKRTEWFKITPDYSHDLFKKFVDRDYGGVQEAEEHSDYQLRREQEQAVTETLNYFKSGAKPAEFLWNAKPRFGKTLSAYDLARKLEAVNVLIVTNRPSIANSWLDDFTKFISHQTTYKFVSMTDALRGKGTMTRDEFIDVSDEDSRMIAFISLQDLKGSKYFGGGHEKLKWVKYLNWDLLVIDEAHEGVDTYKTDLAFDHIKRKYTLHLSGTPFKAIANNKFRADQIFNWTYADEQDAKNNWDRDEINPYEDLPKLNMLTYQLSNMVRGKLEKGMLLSNGENVEYAFDLNEFFSTNGSGKFNHEEDVRKFLDALTGNDKYPFSTSELRGKLKHTFWLLDRVDSAKALKKMLKQHPIFAEYEVVLAAGDGRTDEREDNAASKRSYDKVMEAIFQHDKTITLSVGQLTTGVTVKPWTAVLMLCNMQSSAEYMQAAFRCQNPYRWQEGDQVFMKTDAYIFDFAPERTLIIYDKFANDLLQKTAAGAGTEEDRKENIRRLLNFFPVIGEDVDGTMRELDVQEVLTIPRFIKAQEVIRRGFMSNFLFQNISNVFGAPGVVTEILDKMEAVKQTAQNLQTTMEQAEEIPVDDEGKVIIPEEKVIAATEELFGPKIYENVEIPKGKEIRETPSLTWEKEYARNCTEKVVENIKPVLENEFKNRYELPNKTVTKLEKDIEKKVEETLKKEADKFTIEKNVMETERKEALQQAKTEEEKTRIKEKFVEKAEATKKQFEEKMVEVTQQVMTAIPQEVVRKAETEKLEDKKRDVETDIRDHLRGFSRTIPSFLMAYGDNNLCLKNFDTYIEDAVFKEVTSITLAEFCFLRDGGDYQDPETGETKHFDGRLFDEVVFDESVKEFLALKNKLADYFDESQEEDIFDYIPPQKTNQIFTPRKVVKQMVDALEEENPHIFEDPKKTFADLYMKSGMYITEIVKKLFRNPKMQESIPDDRKRLKHILEKQVFGFAPTEIIYRIAMAYIFGKDEKFAGISQSNFLQVDTLSYAKNGTMQKLLNEKFGGR